MTSLQFIILPPVSVRLIKMAAVHHGSIRFCDFRFSTLRLNPSYSAHFRRRRLFRRNTQGVWLSVQWLRFQVFQIGQCREWQRTPIEPQHKQDAGQIVWPKSAKVILISFVLEEAKKLVSQRYHAAWNPSEDITVEGTCMSFTYWLNDREI